MGRMAKNDVVLLDVVLDRIVAGQGDDAPGRGETFERFVFDQVLKGFDLGEEEINAGWVDGRHDGGIDGFYVFVNGHMVVDSSHVDWPKSGGTLDVYLITCRHHDGFKQEPLDALLASLQELLDLAKDEDALAGAYSSEVLAARGRLNSAYRALSLSKPRVSFNVIYACRGDTNGLGPSIVARGKQIEALLSAYFSAARVSVAFLGASELVERYRQARSFALSLTFSEHLAASQDGYVVLADIAAYRDFVTDEQGHLRRYLFDSNVRDFLGRNRVNSDIIETLGNPSAPNFWWLNNGVTILASGASVVGKQLQMSDIQIVNGLQTTESIFLHFVEKGESASGAGKPRYLLVKVIVTDDEHVRDQVIRATNNQSAVDASALHATDKIQHDIEQILDGHGWFYERRTNYFRNAGKPQASIITPSYLAAAVASLVFKNPVKSGLKGSLAATPFVHAATFSDRHPIGMWPVLVALMRRAEAAVVRQVARVGGPTGRLVANWRGIVAFLVVARHFKSVHYSVQDLARLHVQGMDDILFDEAAVFVFERRTRMAANFEIVRFIARDATRTFGIQGNWLDARKLFDRLPTPDEGEAISIKPEILDSIDAALPPQPWPRHIHMKVAADLSLSKAFVQKAIRELIRQGRRQDQFKGIVLPRHASLRG